MSDRPRRPPLTGRNHRGPGIGGAAVTILKLAGAAGLIAGVFYLMEKRREWTGAAPAAPNPLAQGPPPATTPVPSPAPQPASSNSPPAAPPAGPSSAEQLQNVELTTAASIQRQQLAAAKFKQRQAVAIFDEVTRAIDEWEKELAAWEKTGPPLLMSDEGKRIAADVAEQAEKSTV